MIYEHALKEKKKLDQQINLLQRKINQLPKGKIICTHFGKYTKWYQSDGKTQIYIPKKERRLAEQLALKKYLSLQLKNLQQEKLAIEYYLRHHNTHAEESENVLFTTPAYRELLSPHIKPLSQELFEWQNADYMKNNAHPEHLNHETISGSFVRSKSEEMIHMVLYKNKIPFRYECGLRLGDLTYYPDFTIRHPKTGETYYWEHFGKMDDADYSKNVFSKLQHYTSHGIIPTIQLITTYETKDNPFTINNAEKIVNDYFL